MTYYMFYLNHTGTLYAFTSYKKYALEFMEVRNMKNFTIHKEKFQTETEERLFMKNCHLKRLMESVVEDERSVYSVIETEEEDQKLQDACNEIFDNMVTIRDRIRKFVPLKEKYKTTIEQVTNCYRVIGNNTRDPVLKVNTLKLFYCLFRFTFLNWNTYEMVLTKNNKFT